MILMTTHLNYCHSYIDQFIRMVSYDMVMKSACVAAGLTNAQTGTVSYIFQLKHFIKQLKI